MRRRDFLGMAGASTLGLAAPALSQTNSGLPLVGVLSPGSMQIAPGRIAAMRLGLQQAGFVEGKNYALEVRFANGAPDRLPALASELGALKPAVIVAGANAVPVVHKLFPDLPLVFTGISIDPIAAGWVQSYVHPGGMMTGNVMHAVGGEDGLTAKRIGLFKELVPNLRRLGMIGVEKAALSELEANALRKVAGDLGFELTSYLIRGPDDLASAFASAQRDSVSAFYITGDPLLFINIGKVMPLVAASGKPAVGVLSEWASAGLLMTYSTDLSDGFRHAGLYAGRILDGAKAADLPVEQASKFSFVVNLKTAKTLGIAVPATLLSLADEVIE